MRTFLLLLLLSLLSPSFGASTLYSSQIDWLRHDQGGYFSPKLEFRPLDKTTLSGPNGLFATAPIHAGERVLVIPPAAVVRGRHMCHTTERLVEEHEKGPASNFAPYVGYVFTGYLQNQAQTSVLAAWSDGGKRLLRRVVGGELPLNDLHDSTFREACPKVVRRRRLLEEEEEDPSGLALFEEAYRIVVSRSWNEVLVPVYDMVNHRNGYYHNLDQATTAHDPETPIEVVALREIQANEQLYISYNECYDTDCEDIQWTYVLPDILVDYGFVEQYPRRWNFDTNDGILVLELNQTSGSMEGAEEEQLNAITLEWLNVEQPTLTQVNWLRAHAKRMRQMKDEVVNSLEQLEAKSEGKIIWEFYNALQTALDYAVLYAKPKQEEKTTTTTTTTSSSDNEMEVTMEGDVLTTSSSSPSSYDPLTPQPDPLDYNVFTCTGKDERIQLAEFHTESQYQTISFRHYGTPESRGVITDTCLLLNDWLQTCTSFRAHYHEAFVHYPAQFVQHHSGSNQQQSSIRRVLFLGGGDNMILHEILKHNPSLVIGMELDQQVARSSYRHLATQPHFDHPAVQWWFGDAAKSLRVLPRDYYGTFDLVLVDLQTFVADTLMVTSELSIMDVAMRLLKPHGGILARNEDFVKRENTDFAKYTVDLEYHDVPRLCQQSVNMGSNSVDFLKVPMPSPSDLVVETLVLHELDHFEGWYNYRRNVQKETCQDDDSNDNDNNNNAAENTKDDAEDSIGHGVLLVLEAENVNVSLVTPATIREALETIGLSEISLFQSNERTVFVLREGYLVVRKFSEFRYCAFDLLLWSSFEKQEAARTTLLATVGSQHQTSFRIITGGMNGVDGNSNSNVGPGNTRYQQQQPCQPSDGDDSTPDNLEQSTVNTILRELSGLMQDEGKGTVVVVCGDESLTCSSVEALQASDGTTNVIPIWACPAESPAISVCEKDIQAGLQTAAKIKGLVIDAGAPLVMGQLVHKILKSALSRKQLLQEKYVVLVPMTTSSEDQWRKVLVDRFRTEFEQFSPAYRTELFFNTTTASTEMGVFSSGDQDFYSHLVSVVAAIEKSTGVVSEVRRVDDALVNYVADFEPSRVVTNADYDKRAASKQWMSQKSVGAQAIFQFEIQPPKAPVWPGERVLANYEKNVWTGTWHLAEIVQVKTDGTFDVLYDDGTEQNEPRSAIRKLSKKSFEEVIEAGTRVLIMGGKTWYQGSVLETHDDGTYKLQLYNYEGAVETRGRKDIVTQAEPAYTSKLPPFSAAKLKEVVVDAVESFLPDDTELENDDVVTLEDGVGEGCIVVGFWPSGNVVVTWDGKTHIDVNIMTTEEDIELHKELESVFLEEVISLGKVSHDLHPRGFGGVVNLGHETLEHPIWMVA